MVMYIRLAPILEGGERERREEREERERTRRERKRKREKELEQLTLPRGKPHQYCFLSCKITPPMIFPA
jgi:hypothetical protein